MKIRQHPRRNHTQFRPAKPLLRTIGTVGLAVVVLGGATFAALQSQRASLQNNIIQTASASLKISRDGDTFDAQTAGFRFDNVEPDGPAVPLYGNVFWLRNQGSVDLKLRAALDTTNLGVDGVDLDKVSAVITPIGVNGALGTPQTFPLATLASAANSGGTMMTLVLPMHSTSEYQLQIRMTNGAFDTSSGEPHNITGVNFVFSGVSANAQSS
jgi:hypothetical protein